MTTVADPTAEAWGQLILRKRGERSQTAIAEAIGAHQTSISLWEKGKRTPPTRYHRALVRVLDITAEELAAVYTGAAA